MSDGSARTWPLVHAFRALFAVLALVSQLTLGALVPASGDGSDARLRSVAVLCGSAARGSAAPAAPGHRHPDRAACTTELALELPAVILMPAPALPAPVPAMASHDVLLPPARAPPAAFAWALHARAPPFLA